MNIFLLVSRPVYTQKQLEKLSLLGNVHIVDAQKFSAQQVVEVAKDAEILIAGPSGIEKISKELLSQMEHLKMISILSVGTHWIDLDATRKHNIVVSNIKGANAEAVAEHTWGMILDLAKRITELNRDMFTKGVYKVGPYQGREVFGKTLGIIGLGSIGQKVARIAKGFEMKVLGINKSGNPVDGVELTDLTILCKESDVIAVCVPLTNETQHMIGQSEIAQMKDHVIIVNCSREEAVNKEAIVAAVQSGKVFGYGVETGVLQSISQSDAYFSHPRILVTPHNAFNTLEAEENSFEVTLQNIQGFLRGEPQNIVTSK